MHNIACKGKSIVKFICGRITSHAVKKEVPLMKNQKLNQIAYPSQWKKLTETQETCDFF